jgi:hypothetical protein
MRKKWIISSSGKQKCLVFQIIFYCFSGECTFITKKENRKFVNYEGYKKLCGRKLETQFREWNIDFSFASRSTVLLEFPACPHSPTSRQLVIFICREKKGAVASGAWN